MSMFDTTKWYRHEFDGTERRPLVPEPDKDHVVPVVSRSGYYEIVDAENLSLIPERYTVEWRKPRVGDEYLFDGSVVRALCNYDNERWVIVKDEVNHG